MTESEYDLVVAYTRAKVAKNLIEEIPPVHGIVKGSDRDRMLVMLEDWCLGLFKKVMAIRDEEGESEEN